MEEITENMNNMKINKEEEEKNDEVFEEYKKIME